MISAPGPIELLFILGLALLVLGPSRLPDAARSIGRGVRELRDALQGNHDDDDGDYYEPEDLDSAAGHEEDEEAEEERLPDEPEREPEELPERS